MKQKPEPISVVVCDGRGGYLNAQFEPWTPVAIVEAPIAFERGRLNGITVDVWMEGFSPHNKVPCRRIRLDEATGDDSFLIDQERRLNYVTTPVPQRASFWSRGRLA